MLLRGVSAQQRRARPHPLDRCLGGARPRRRRRGLYRRRSRRLLGARPAAGAAAADQGHDLQSAHPGAARQGQGPPCRRAARRRARAKAAISPRMRSATSPSSSSRCRRSSIWKRRVSGASATVHDDVRGNVAAHVRQGRGDYAAAARQGRSRHRPPLPLRSRRLVADRDPRHRRQLGCARQSAHDLGHHAGAGVLAQRACRACWA